jgi:hypothetical protein
MLARSATPRSGLLPGTATCCCSNDNDDDDDAPAAPAAAASMPRGGLPPAGCCCAWRAAASGAGSAPLRRAFCTAAPSAAGFMMQHAHSEGVLKARRCQRLHTAGSVVLNQVKRAAAALGARCASARQKPRASDANTSSSTSSVACMAGDCASAAAAVVAAVLLPLPSPAPDTALEPLC